MVLLKIEWWSSGITFYFNNISLKKAPFETWWFMLIKVLQIGKKLQKIQVCYVLAAHLEKVLSKLLWKKPIEAEHILIFIIKTKNICCIVELNKLQIYIFVERAWYKYVLILEKWNFSDHETSKHILYNFFFNLIILWL